MDTFYHDPIAPDTRRFARITERITKDLPVQIDRFMRANDGLLGLSPDAPTLAELSSLIGDKRYLEDLLLRVLHSNMDSERVGNVLNQMHWTLLTINHSDFSLLTSDRPITIALPIGHPNARLFIPVSPNDVFVILPGFTKATDISVKVLAQGTGQ